MSTEDNMKAKVLKEVPASLGEMMAGLRTKAVSLMMIGQVYRANVEDQCSRSLRHQSAQPLRRIKLITKVCNRF